MRALGLYPHPVDGITGPWTQQAVRTFQAQHGLTVDGIAGTADARGTRQARQAERSGRGPMHRRPARLGRRGAPVPAPRARLRAGGLRRRVRAQHAERGSALPVGRTPAGRRRRRASDAERPSGDPGRDRRARSARCASSAPSRGRSATASAGSHRAAGTPGSTSPSRRGRRSTLAASASSPSPASTPAATATWSWSSTGSASRAGTRTCPRIAASVGQRVSGGQTIGYVGSTGHCDRSPPALRGPPLRHAGRSDPLPARLPRCGQPRASREGARLRQAPAACAARTATRAAEGPIRSPRASTAAPSA